MQGEQAGRHAFRAEQADRQARMQGRAIRRQAGRGEQAFRLAGMARKTGRQAAQSRQAVRREQIWPAGRNGGRTVQADRA
jgi:hypothetical protein